MGYLVDNIRREEIKHLDTIYKLTLSLTGGETARQVFLQAFFRKSMQKRLFPRLVENIIKKLRNRQFDFASQPREGMTLFLHLIATDYSGKNFDSNAAALWLETLAEIDDATRQLFLYGAKQHLETIQKWFDTKKETEILRKQNASNYSQIVIEIWCRECRKTSPVIVDIPDIVRSDSMIRPCPKCNNSNSLVIPIDRLRSELFL